MSQHPHSSMSRRNFAKLTTTAAAGFAILSSKRVGAESNADTLKVGLLGCGNRGTGAAINMLEGGNNVKLVAMADLFQDRLDGAKEKLKSSDKPGVVDSYAVADDQCFVGLDAYKKILETDIDILIEGTLPYSRPTHLAAAAAAGKHIFTEKPVAVDPVGIRSVMETGKVCKDKGLSFVSGTQRRHFRNYMQTMDKLHNGAIGDVLSLRVYWCGELPFVYDREPGWTDFEYRIRNWINNCWVNGDNIVEQHVHNLDIGNWVMNGHPASVFASGGRNWKPNTEKYGDQYDHFSCDYEFPNGVHMYSFSRHWDGTDGGVFEEAVGTKGKSTCRDLGEDKEELSGYVWEHRDLCASIRGELPYTNEAQRIAESTMTAIMGRMSAYTGKKLNWDEALNSDLSLVPAEWSFDKEYPVAAVPCPVAKDKIK